jgi:ubiquinone/menaquinone biosynthesis C-methylase UbiE
VRGSEGVRGAAQNCELEHDSSSVFQSLPFLADVRDGYERWAPTYDDFPNPLLARELRHVLPLLPVLRNRSVLDVACGTGRWLTRLMTIDASLAVGIDLSSAMLRVAGDKRELSGKVVQGDCLRLPFRSSTFDFLICSFALGHIQDLRNAAQEFSRVMKPGADLFVTDLHPEAYAKGWRTGFRDRRSAVQVQTLPHSAEDILRAFNAAGCGCVTHVGLCLGVAEQTIFAEAGKQHLFRAAGRVPAVFFCHLKRVSRATAQGRIS